MRFAVDLDELARVIGVMGACEEALSELTRRIDARVASLHLDWQGPAAQAHRLAHEEWGRGLQTMRLALADFRVAADVARANYDEAVAANVEVWRQTR